MKAQKRQITSTLNVISRELGEHFLILQFALKQYTKKRGALGQARKPSLLGERDAFSVLLSRLTLSLARVRLVLSTKQSKANLRVQMHLLSPWVPQIDRIMSNVVRICNDRVSMLWRPRPGATASASSPCLGVAFALHRDLLSFAVVLKNTIEILCSLNIALQLPRRVPVLQPSIAVASRCLILKIHHCLQAVLPSMIVRIETHVAERLKSHAMALLGRVAGRGERMYGRAGGEGAGADIVRRLHDSVVSAATTTLVASMCTEASRQRVISVAVACCCDSLLDHVLSQKVKFDEQGVLAMHAHLQELLSLAAQCKDAASLPLAATVASEQAAWSRANEVLQLLLFATGDKVRSKGGRRWDTQADLSCDRPCFLTASEQDAWYSLGHRRGWPLLLFCLHCSSTRKKSAVVSISPVLITNNI